MPYLQCKGQYRRIYSFCKGGHSLRTLYKTHKLLEAILAHYESMNLDPDFKAGIELGLNTALKLVNPQSDEVFENYWGVLVQEEEGRQ